MSNSWLDVEYQIEWNGIPTLRGCELSHIVHAAIDYMLLHNRDDRVIVGLINQNAKLLDLDLQVVEVRSNHTRPSLNITIKKE